MSIENLNIEQKVPKEQVENTNFLDSKKVYENYSNGEISQDVFTALYEKYVNQLSDKNKNLLSKFFDKNFFYKRWWTKEILATILFLYKKWDKFWKRINLFLNKKPALIHKMVKWFFDEVESIIENEKKEQKANQNKQDIQKQQGALKKLIKKNKDQMEKEIARVAKLVDEKLEQTKPELNKQIHYQASKLHQTYPEISPDQAYLITFSYFYQKDLALQNELKLDSQDLAIIQSVKEKFGYIAKALIFVDVDNNFNQQTEILASNYDDKLKNSLEVKDLKVKNEYVLKILEINNFKEIAEKDLNTDYEVFVKYLQNSDKAQISSDKLKKFEKEKQKLFKKYINSFQEEYLSSYKTTAMKIYLNEVFWLFDKSL